MEILRRRSEPPKPRAAELPTPHAAELPGGDPPSSAAQGGVQVIWGASVQTLELGGMQVRQARELLQTLLRVDPGAPALINGEPARPTQRINAGDTVEFVIHAGEKGRGH
jgi:hypothetical protein